MGEGRTCGVRLGRARVYDSASRRRRAFWSAAAVDAALAEARQRRRMRGRGGNGTRGREQRDGETGGRRDAACERWRDGESGGATYGWLGRISPVLADGLLSAERHIRRYLHRRRSSPLRRGSLPPRRSTQAKAGIIAAKERMVKLPGMDHRRQGNHRRQGGNHRRLGGIRRRQGADHPFQGGIVTARAGTGRGLPRTIPPSPGITDTCNSSRNLDWSRVRSWFQGN